MCVCVCVACMCTSMLKGSLDQGVVPLPRTHFGPLPPGCVNCNRGLRDGDWEVGTACNSQVAGKHASICSCVCVHACIYKECVASVCVWAIFSKEGKLLTAVPSCKLICTCSGMFEPVHLGPLCLLCWIRQLQCCWQHWNKLSGKPTTFSTRDDHEPDLFVPWAGFS